VCAFLEVYCTQPLLPLLTRLFHASKTGVGLTVSATTLGVALSAPIFGALTERLARKRVIVASLIGVSIPTILAATSTSLAQLVFWRFLQGILVPGIVAVVITYIGEEWPVDRVALIMGFYVSGTALGGFIGRVSSGILADRFSWQVSFLTLGAASLLGAAAVAAWLPKGRRRLPAPVSTGDHVSFPYQVQGLLRNRRLVATFAVGFNVLFSLVGVFTWITFHLSAAPFSLSTTALSSLFFVYLIGLVVTPAAGFLITKVGLRTGIASAICCSMTGVLLTLAPSLPVIILGLAMLSTGVFISQTATQSHLRVAAPPGSRRGSRRLLGSGQVAGLRGLHRGHASRRAGHRPGGLASAKSYRERDSPITRFPITGESCIINKGPCPQRGDFCRLSRDPGHFRTPNP
jgi:MFS family permease